MHGVIVKSNSADHNGQSYRVRVRRTDHGTMQHEAHTKDSGNDRAVPKRADCQS